MHGGRTDSVSWLYHRARSVDVRVCRRRRATPPVVVEPRREDGERSPAADGHLLGRGRVNPRPRLAAVVPLRLRHGRRLRRRLSVDDREVGPGAT